MCVSVHVLSLSSEMNELLCKIPQFQFQCLFNLKELMLMVSFGLMEMADKPYMIYPFGLFKLQQRNCVQLLALGYYLDRNTWELGPFDIYFVLTPVLIDFLRKCLKEVSFYVALKDYFLSTSKSIQIGPQFSSLCLFSPDFFTTSFSLKILNSQSNSENKYSFKK